MNKYLSLLLILISATAIARQVTDQNHLTIEVPDQVERIVTLPIPMPSIIMAVDESSQRVIAVNRSSHNDFVEGFLAKIYPDVINIPYNIANEGFAPNMESLAALNPDVVIQWGDRGDSIVKPIKAAGFPVLTMTYGETRYVADWLRMAGDLLNKSARGNQLADWFEKNYDLLREKNNAIPQQQRPKVIYLYRYSGGLTVAGKGTSYQGDITLAGGKNMAEQLSGFAPVNVEQLIVWNPDIILLNNFEGEVTPQMLYHDARLKHIAAIKNKAVYVYPRGGFRWDPPSQESILSLNWLSALFQPQHTQQDFRQQMRETYQLLYHYSLNNNEIDHILRIKDNQDSINYCQLFCQP